MLKSDSRIFLKAADVLQFHFFALVYVIRTNTQFEEQSIKAVLIQTCQQSFRKVRCWISAASGLYFTFAFVTSVLSKKPSPTELNSHLSSRPLAVTPP